MSLSRRMVKEEHLLEYGVIEVCQVTSKSKWNKVDHPTQVHRVTGPEEISMLM